MEIKIIFRKGVSGKKFKEISEANVGKTYYAGRSDKRNQVIFDLNIKGTKNKVIGGILKLAKLLIK